MDTIDSIVIGAGVVGLAVARALALMGREVLILEAESAIGSVTSARNSGVIHAGLYYRPGSFKARFCVKGREMLYAYAQERGIAHKNCGKLVVATHSDQVERLRALKANAERNGVGGLRLLMPAEAKELEPQLFCAAVLHVPHSGIVDQHAYLLALLGDAEAAGATLALQAPAASAEVTDDGFTVTAGGAAKTQIACHTLINAAGLGAQDFARRLGGFDAAAIPPRVLAKGSYFSLAGKSPFQMLIYPLPAPGSSGLHASCDLGGRLRFGPDVEWVEAIDYHVDPARRPMFEDAVRRYWPGLPLNALQPDFAGVRPKLARASPHDSDFVVQDVRAHGIPRLVNLFGIESPGLTASLALAEHVVRVAG
ncbi:MAG TPA: NAD(P)/FAD-dependent oxidoreductase [Alphaproteobacteria bacterium]|nr:NAD(P)/FAD-dependent oxidoreductase [Alphaproteobacteria bacterium]